MHLRLRPVRRLSGSGCQVGYGRALGAAAAVSGTMAGLSWLVLSNVEMREDFTYPAWALWTPFVGGIVLGALPARAIITGGCR